VAVALPLRETQAGVLVPIVCQLPLQDKTVREAPAAGFSKKGMWGSIDDAAKARKQ
jgi:hypothetical protein